MTGLVRRGAARPLPNPITALAALGLYTLLSRAQQRQAYVAPPQWLSLKEASIHSGLSVALLRRLIASQKLPALKDGCTKVRLSDLDNVDNLSEMSEASKKLVSLASEIRRTRRR